MEFDKRESKWAEYLGFIVAYFVFTTILYFILHITHKLPGDWAYWHIMLITAAATLLGMGIRRLIK